MMVIISAATFLCSYVITGFLRGLPPRLAPAPTCGLEIVYPAPFGDSPFCGLEEGHDGPCVAAEMSGALSLSRPSSGPGSTKAGRA